MTEKKTEKCLWYRKIHYLRFKVRNQSIVRRTYYYGDNGARIKIGKN